MDTIKLFVPNLPATMTERRLRNMITNDRYAIISFVRDDDHALALVEIPSPAEAEDIERALKSAKIGTQPLNVIRGNSAEGLRHDKLFRDRRCQELRAVEMRTTSMRRRHRAGATAV